MDTPQEVEVWFVLPALRREFVLAFKNKGLKQKEIAKIMHVTEAAISQYVKKKRGNEVTFEDNIIASIKKTVSRTVNNYDYRFAFHTILKKYKDSRLICNICNSQINTPIGCDVCYR